MKRPFLIVLIAAIAIAVALLLAPKFRHAKTAASPPARTDSSEPAPTLQSDTGPFRYHVDDPVPMGNQDATAQQLVDYHCQTEADCIAKINVGTTESEAKWLRSHGYPSPREEAKMRAMPISELEQLATQGNAAAQAILGSREIALGHADKGKAWLYKASMQGSVYASIQYAEAYATDPQLRDITESLAFYRLAYLLGDWKASRRLYAQFPEAGVAELSYADRRAMRLYTNLLALRVRERQRISFGPRPLDE